MVLATQKIPAKAPGRAVHPGDETTAKCAEMSLAGMSQRAIARELNITQPAVHYHMKKAMKVWRHEVSGTYEEQVAKMSARLDGYLPALEGKISKGDVRAVEQAVKIEDRRARLLGLDFSDQVSAARLKLEARKVELMADAFNAAMDAIDASPEQRRLAAETLLSRLEPDGEPPVPTPTPKALNPASTDAEG